MQLLSAGLTYGALVVAASELSGPNVPQATQEVLGYAIAIVESKGSKCTNKTHYTI